MCQKVALAQALLARPGLLVLDEAWTGLDQAARGTLDAAVGERLADGGVVMFVDHQQARLAGQVSQRWQLGSGGVRLLDGPGAAAAAEPGHRGPTVLIELAGLDADSLKQLAVLPGVASVSPVPSLNAGDRMSAHVTVPEVQSDVVLRQLLSWDGVHVGAVRPGRQRPGAGEGR
jgi:ABC-2 type transport system ATP-binding protein